jgi:HupE / UreJ protein
MPASPCPEPHARPAGRRLGLPWWRALVALCLAGLCAAPAQAHKASDAYLSLSRQGELIALRWDVALRDLDNALALDANGDGQLTWGEIKARRADIEAHLMGRLRLQAVGMSQACALRASPGEAPLERRVDGAYFVLRLAGACALPQGQLRLSYRLLADIDPTHRGLLQVRGVSGQVWSLDPAGRALTVRVPDARQVAQAPWPHAMPTSVERVGHPAPGAAQGEFMRVAYTPTVPTPDTDTTGEASAPAQGDRSASFLGMVRDGIHHILIGTDHVLFLICLLLPAVLRPATDRDPRHAAPVAGLSQALRPVLITISTFTLAHSLTLALASLNLVQPSPRVIEPAIALTIALAALDNIRPIFAGWRNTFTFLFGLVHGFGFANVLNELSLSPDGFVQALLGFNLGVEIGQLLIVGPTLTVFMLLRRHAAYARLFMPMGSALIIVVALGWWVERVFDLGFMPV